MKEFIQEIDAGLGGSVRLSVGELLGECLVNSDNMIVWEM